MATKSIYNQERSDEEEEYSEKYKPKVTMSGRLTKKPVEYAMYTEKINDEIEEEDEVDEE